MQNTFHHWNMNRGVPIPFCGQSLTCLFVQSKCKKLNTITIYFSRNFKHSRPCLTLLVSVHRCKMVLWSVQVVDTTEFLSAWNGCNQNQSRSGSFYCLHHAQPRFQKMAAQLLQNSHQSDIFLLAQNLQKYSQLKCRSVMSHSPSLKVGRMFVEPGTSNLYHPRFKEESS